ncbi:acyltransferase [Providencia hangzhouensis]|uniref:acyltransferase n=1 Tax=Providencia hangzhouensis TaxID=3031799 RepID=UPI0034DD8B7B
MSDRILWVDYLRAIACLCVVLLHVSVIYVLNIEKIDDNNFSNWILSDYLNSITRICVPIFFMISGYFFFSEKKPKVKNFMRLFLSLLFYSLMAYVMYFTSSFLFSDSKNIKYNFFSEPAFYHLWFFYPLIVIYLLSSFVKIRNDSAMLGFILISFIFVFLSKNLSVLTDISFGFSFDNFFSIDGSFVFYFLYAVAGACIGNIDIKKYNISSLFLILMIIIPSIIIAYLTYVKTMEKGYYFDVLFSFTSPLVYIMSISMFVLFIKISDRLNPSRVINLLSRNSLAIYGTHAFFIAILAKIFKYQNGNAFVFIPIVFVITLLCSIFSSILIKLIDKKGYVS